MRGRLLGELARYARGGRFPKNRDFPGRLVPYFIDAAGTRCAMAHLIESTGDVELVAGVAAGHNHARVRELDGDPLLGAWLARAGLTAAEAARIQPSYCYVTKAEACFCERVDIPSGVIEATVVGTQGANSAVATVEAVHGDAGPVGVGEQIMITSFDGIEVGDSVLVPVDTSQGAVIYQLTFTVLPDGNIDLTHKCQLDVPTLSKADAIEAILAAAPLDPSDCAASLAAVDPRWDESQCEGGGCSSSAGGASPILVGTALLAAALWSRRWSAS